MPFVYSFEGAPATPYQTHATPNTEDPTVVMRQAVRGFDLTALFVLGRGAALTAITGIGYRVRRWTTVGTGGTAVNSVAPRRIGTTASTAVVDKASAIVAGTVAPAGGGFQLSFGCGAAGPGGWVARDADAAIHVEATSLDELDINSVCGIATMNHHVSGEFAE